MTEENIFPDIRGLIAPAAVIMVGGHIIDLLGKPVSPADSWEELEYLTKKVRLKTELAMMGPDKWRKEE